MKNYISTIKSLYQLTKLIFWGFMASKMKGNERLEQKVAETVLNPPAQPSQGECGKQIGVLDLDADYCPYCR